MGKDDFGLLGDGDADSYNIEHARPIILTALAAVCSHSADKVVGVSCGGWHSLFWTQSGKLFGCGKGEYGRLGGGSEASSGEPVRVILPEDVRVVKAAAGGSHSMVSCLTCILLFCPK